MEAIDEPGFKTMHPNGTETGSVSVFYDDQSWRRGSGGEGAGWHKTLGPE